MATPELIRKLARIIDENTSDCYPMYGETDCEQAAIAVLKHITGDPTLADDALKGDYHKTDFTELYEQNQTGGGI